jgi:hypothetical protein
MRTFFALTLSLLCSLAQAGTIAYQLGNTVAVKNYVGYIGNETDTVMFSVTAPSVVSLNIEAEVIAYRRTGPGCRYTCLVTEQNTSFSNADLVDSNGNVLGQCKAGFTLIAARPGAYWYLRCPAVALPAGDYSLTFTAQSYGRAGYVSYTITSQRQ